MGDAPGELRAGGSLAVTCSAVQLGLIIGSLELLETYVTSYTTGGHNRPE
jgi:hypothetical protein